MRLISNIMDKKMELYNEFELNHNYIKSVWNFYCVYNIAVAFIGFEDKLINTKNSLIRTFILTGDGRYYFKLKKYMKDDINVINQCQSLMQEIREDSDYFGDKDLRDMIAISVLDDN